LLLVKQKKKRRRKLVGRQTYGKFVMSGAKYEFRGSVVSRTDVGHIWFALDKDLGTSKVAKFENVLLSVHKKVLRLDVSMTDPHLMDAVDCSE
jgi:hypothetical protein